MVDFLTAISGVELQLFALIIEYQCLYFIKGLNEWRAHFWIILFCNSSCNWKNPNLWHWILFIHYVQVYKEFCAFFKVKSISSLWKWEKMDAKKICKIENSLNQYGNIIPNNLQKQMSLHWKRNKYLKHSIDIKNLESSELCIQKMR